MKVLFVVKGKINLDQVIQFIFSLWFQEVGRSGIEFDFEPKTERQKRNTNVKIIKKTNPEIIQKLFHLSKT